jgi:glutaredoxin
MKTLILYSKPGCHLCEGLQAKLETLPLQLEIRDITQNETWFQKYQYEVPVLCQPVAAPQTCADVADYVERSLPRVSPRASIQQVAQMLQKHMGPFEA